MAKKAEQLKDKPAPKTTKPEEILDPTQYF